MSSFYPLKMNIPLLTFSCRSQRRACFLFAAWMLSRVREKLCKLVEAVISMASEVDRGT